MVIRPLENFLLALELESFNTVSAQKVTQKWIFECLICVLAFSLLADGGLGLGGAFVHLGR